MKIMKIIILLLMTTCLATAQSNYLSYFNAKSDGKNITVEWKTLDESQISRFEVERAGNDNIFKYVHSLEKKGIGYSYQFIDEDAFRRSDNGEITTQSKTTFSYRLKIIKLDGSNIYSNSIFVAHNVSSIRRTWGMIKEMFR